MTDDDNHPIHSTLTQSLTRNGKTVRIGIYQDGKGGWILEVVDEYWNSTVWDDPFSSDRDALDEALRTIEEDGIESLIGAPPDFTSTSPPTLPQAMTPLSEEEMDELDSFLMSDATSDETMLLDCLDGYLTAIAIGPVTLKPSEWLPRVWGPTTRDEPAFDTIEQAERITVLIMRQLNGIIGSLQHNPDAFEPVFNTYAYPDSPQDYLDGEMWAYGFMTGINLKRPSWKGFFDEPNSQEVLRPIYLLGADEVTTDEEALTQTPEQREKLSEQIPASVASIYRYWLPYRLAMAERTIATTYQREHPKIGRNDSCPCGSGKKFKKCCGSATVLH